MRNYPCHCFNKPYTVSELNIKCDNVYDLEKITKSATDFMNFVSNMDYNTITEASVKKPFIYYLHDSTEYKGIEYENLVDGRYEIKPDNDCFDIFLSQYPKDVKSNKIKIQGKYYTSEDLCILHHGCPASRGILRFKVDSAKDLELVKHILFIRDTESERKDNRRDTRDYGGVDNSRYMKNSDIKLKLNTWYEIAFDLSMSAVVTNGSHVYENYETSKYKPSYICPIYIKELK